MKQYQKIQTLIANQCNDTPSRGGFMCSVLDFIVIRCAHK